MSKSIELGKKIKQVRIESGMLQKDLAALIGVAPSTIQRYESGKIQDAKIPVIESIARALNVNPAWLIGKSTDKALKKMDENTRPSEDERVNEILAKNESLREFYNILETLPDDQQIELLETAIFLAEKKVQQKHK